MITKTSIRIPEYIELVIEKLENAGFEAYIVGGCVRDSVIGITPNDYDVTTSAEVSEMKEVFKDMKLIPTGEKHGTVTILSNGMPVEITTFRLDGGYEDHRHPDSVTFTRKLSEDLARRDFTINAMAYSKRTGLIDLYGGIVDIKEKKIRAVGDPYKRFDEDALRILRGIRFAAKLGFKIEPTTYEAMNSLKGNLSFVSVERIYKELSGMLETKNAVALQRVLLKYREIVFEIIPELRPSNGLEQENKYHCYDVYTHIVYCVGATPNDLSKRLAMLLHDIGKPAAEKIIDGRQRFLGHPEKSVEIAETIMRRLKAPNNITEKVLTYVKFHEYIKDPLKEMRINEEATLTNAFIGHFVKEIGDGELAVDMCDIFKADLAGKSDFAHNRTASLIDRICLMIYNYVSSGKCYKVSQLDISGNDLINAGIKPGKQIGEILNMLLDEVINEKIPNSKDKLLERAIIENKTQYLEEINK